MKHYGDITKISGYSAPSVDCIIGGSPCQDLSVAGKRAGLDGERSGLFMDQIRIIKEMREKDEKNGRSGVDVRPRYMVWENVPGAFSSNKGEDFRIVLEETAKVKDPNAVIPEPPKRKWTTCGAIVGDGWSIAWRVLDAQFWGVPQRRRRIALIADFGGESAPEILFVRKSVSGDTQPSEPKRKGASSDATGGFGESDSKGSNVVSFEPGIASREGGHIYEGVSGTLRANAGDNQMATAYTLKIRSGCEGGGKGALIQTDKSATLSTLQDQTLFQPVGVDIYNTVLTGNKACSLTAGGYTSTGTCPKVITVDQGGGKSACNISEGQAPTLTCTHGGEPAVCYSIENHPADSRVDIDESGKVQTLTSRMGTGGGNVPMVMSPTYQDKVGALCARDYKGVGSQYVEEDKIIVQGITNYIVRRLTPLECERLQGFPDNWTLIGEPVEEDVADYISVFDESKYIKPNYEDFGLTWDDVIDYQEVEDGELEDVELESRIFAYRKALDKAEREATKRVKIGTHKETFYYYTDANGKRKKCSDSARYKALGNSIALPPWKWVLKRLCACYEREVTMASLFDGIGGFPYKWEQLNGKGSCLWASEIEEFPIAVTKLRIGE